MTAWPPYARLARAETLGLRGTDFIAAARLAGASPARIVLRHIAPLCMPSLVVRVTLDMSSIILTAAGLGFLGMGAQPPSPEWGAMIATARRFILDQWWVPTIPGLAIFAASARVQPARRWPSRRPGPEARWVTNACLSPIAGEGRGEGGLPHGGRNRMFVTIDNLTVAFPDADRPRPRSGARGQPHAWARRSSASSASRGRASR